MAFDPAEVRRVAKLARLSLTSDEEERLAADLVAITSSFSDLATFAEHLESPPEAAPGTPREDAAVVSPDARGVVDIIPLRDRGGAIRVPRGPP